MYLQLTPSSVMNTEAIFPTNDEGDCGPCVVVNILQRMRGATDFCELINWKEVRQIAHNLYETQKQKDCNKWGEEELVSHSIIDGRDSYYVK